MPGFDGKGSIPDILAFIHGYSGSFYSVSSSGVVSGGLCFNTDTTLFTGQLTSQNTVRISIPDHNFIGPFSKITNPGALTDTLVGVLISVSYGQKNIVLVLNSQGQVISSAGLTTPVSGRVYADSGMFVGHVRTGESSNWNEFTITGIYAHDSLNGVLSVDAPHSDNDGTVRLIRKGIVTGVRTPNPSIPAFYILKQNYPNPFNPSTVIRYQIAEKSNVSLKVFDLLGREVATLVNEVKSAGSYTATFNATNLSSGVFFYRLQTGSFTDTKRLVLLK